MKGKIHENRRNKLGWIKDRIKEWKNAKRMKRDMEDRIWRLYFHEFINLGRRL